nr:DUF2341 domain-containing protein [Candidatus Freyarchaeota archaeon]
MMRLKNRLYKHKRALIALMAISIFTISIGIPVFLSSQSPNTTNYYQTLLLNKLPNNNSIDDKASWLSEWGYRKSHTINGSTAGVQTNYQMRIVVNYGSGTDNDEKVYCNAHCRYDFSDVRFTNSDGATQLNYWMESKYDGDNATFWVQINNIPASPNTAKIYIYYGKSDATTASNGDNTFIFFDDFLGSSINNTKWNTRILSGDSITVSNSECYIDCNTPSGWCQLRTNNNFSESNCIYETKCKGVSSGSGNAYVPDLAIWDVWTYPVPDRRKLNYLIEQSWAGYYGGSMRTFFVYGGPSTEVIHIGYSQCTQFVIMQIVRESSEFAGVFINLENSLAVFSGWCTVANFSAYLSLSCYDNSEAKYDWVRIRNYCSPEPTHGSWGGEEGQSPLIFTHEFADGNQEWDASSELGVELSLNLNNSVSLNISRMVGGVGGGAPLGLAFLECFVSISVNDSSALQGINITIHYTDSKVAELGLNENTLTIWYRTTTSRKWTQLPSTVDTINNTVTAYTDHLTTFAILGIPIPSGTPGTPISSYLPFLLLFLLMPSGLNPLVYLALGFVILAIIIAAGLGSQRSREEQVPEAEAPTRYAQTTPSPTRYARAQTPPRSGEEASGQRIVLELRRAMPKYGTRSSTVSKRGKPSKTRVPVGDLVARRTALKDLMEEVNARFAAGKLTHEEYVEIYSKYSAKLSSVEKKLRRFTSPIPVLGHWCCMFCGTELTEDKKFCPSCGRARLKCPVCQIDIVLGDPLVKCPNCGTLGHKDHLLEWVKVKGYCPSCKKKLRETDIV